MIAKPSEAFAGRLPDKWDTQSISEWLLMLSALLWPFDVAARRLQLPDHWWAKAMSLWRRKPQAQTESGREEVLSRLGEKRSGIQRGADPVLSANAAGAAEAKTPRSKGSQGSQQKESANEPDAADKTFNRLLEAKKRRSK